MGHPGEVVSALPVCRLELTGTGLLFERVHRAARCEGQRRFEYRLGKRRATLELDPEAGTEAHPDVEIYPVRVGAPVRRAGGHACLVIAFLAKPLFCGARAIPRERLPVRVALGKLERLLDLLARRGRLVDRQRLIGLIVEFDFRELHVERQVDQHRSGTPGAHDEERLAEHARHQRRLTHGARPFRHRLGDRFDVDGLKVFLVEPRAWRLPGDAENRDRIRDR